MADVEVCSRGPGPGYIALRVKREPLDQTDLRDDLDAILGGRERSFWKLTGRGHHGRLGGMEVGLAPPCSPSGSAVVWCLLVSSGTF
jgi:hypothetical protein